MPGHSLYLQAGSTTVYLTGTNIKVRRAYAPATQTTGDGTPVTDAIDIAFVGDTRAAMQGAIADLQSLLAANLRPTTGTQNRLYLCLQLMDDNQVWRSEVLASRLDLAPDAWTSWISGVVEGTLHISRVAYWEGALATLQVKTYSTSGAFANSGDAQTGQNNWIEFASPAGDLPAPLNLKLAFKQSTASPYMWLANQALTGDPDADYILEGAASDWGNPWSTAGAGEHIGFFWRLTSAQQLACAGGPFRFISVWNSITTGVYLKASIWLHSGAPSYLALTQLYPPGNWVRADGAKVLDLGTFNVPPGQWGAGATGNLGIQINVRTTGAASANSYALMLLAAGAGVYRELRQEGWTCASGDWFRDNGPDGVTVVEEPGGNIYPIVFPRGTPLHVWPGRQNYTRLVLAPSSGASFSDTNAVTVSAQYRPRRASLGYK